ERRLAQHHLADRFVDDLLEARHVGALLVWTELDDAFEARREQLLAAVLPDPDHLLDSGHADAGEAHLDARQLSLDVDYRHARGLLLGHRALQGRQPVGAARATAL